MVVILVFCEWIIKLFQIKQSLEQVKSRANTFKVSIHVDSVHYLPSIKWHIKNDFLFDVQPELLALDETTLEEEHKALLSDKEAEDEYMQSLRDQIQKLKVSNCTLTQHFEISHTETLPLRSEDFSCH